MLEPGYLGGKWLVEGDGLTWYQMLRSSTSASPPVAPVPLYGTSGTYGRSAVLAMASGGRDVDWENGEG